MQTPPPGAPPTGPVPGGQDSEPKPRHWHTHADGTSHAHPHEHGAEHHHHDPHHHESATPGMRVMELARPILAHNDRLAERNRGFLRAKGIWAVNLVSSPGSGKTTLLERTLSALNDGDRRRASVIVGDLATARDAQRLRATGADAVQITTGEACHLDAEMVARGMDQLDLSLCRWLFIENVGNLVCPAAFDLGEQRRVALVSITEGEDKPLKYPAIFKSADLVLLTKMDLAPVLGADIDALIANLRAVNPKAAVIKVSARTGEGMAAWLGWIRESSANPSSGFSKVAERA